MTSELDSLRDDLSTKEKSLAQTNSENSQLEKSNSECQIALSQLTTQRDQLTQQLARATSDNETAAARIESANQDELRLRGEIDELTRTTKAAELELQKKTAAIDELTATNRSDETTIATLRAEYESSQAQHANQIAQRESEFAVEKEKIAAESQAKIESILAEGDAKTDQYVKRIEELEQKMVEASKSGGDQLAQVQTELQDARKTVEKLTLELDTAKNSISASQVQNCL